jgi:ribosomal protein S18 acetylase RimI-like enzyme
MATSDSQHRRMKIEESTKQGDAAVDWVHTRLRQYNTAKPGSNDFKVLNLFLRDENGELQGGLLGWTLWSWLHIDALWVEESRRRQGYGLRLLQEAERIATQRGCTLAETDSFTFQAPGFYQRAGYTVFGKLEGIGGRFTRYYLRKDLGAGA